MDLYDTIESIIDSSGGSVRGRTAVQKLVYLAKQKIPELDVPEFRPHYYGPYSAEVAMSLSRLVQFLFVSESRIPGNIAVGYEYRLTRDGNEVLDGVKRDQVQTYRSIRDFVQKCKSLCDLNILALSFASKVHYMTVNSPARAPSTSRDNLRAYAESLGWKMDPGEIDVGIRLLEDLDLAPVAK